MTKSAIWLNEMHAAQRDIGNLVRIGSTEEIKVISSHSSDREDIFMVADEYFVEPSFDQGSEYSDWALDAAISNRVSGIIAMRHRKALIEVRDKFLNKGVRLAAGAGSTEMIDLCDNKDRFTVAMKAAGIPVTETIAVNTIHQLKSAIAEIAGTGTEVCVKPSVGIFGRGFWRFVPGLDPFSLFSTLECNDVDPDVYLAAYERAENPGTLIVMQFLPGVESSIDCVCDNGKLVAHAVRQKSNRCQTVFTGGREADIARAVVAELKLDGLVNVQTKEDAEGTPVLLEVNTRPSGGVAYSAAAGVNLPLACARMLLGEKTEDTSLASPVVIRLSEVTYPLPRATAALNAWVS